MEWRGHDNCRLELEVWWLALREVMTSRKYRSETIANFCASWVVSFTGKQRDHEKKTNRMLVVAARYIHHL